MNEGANERIVFKSGLIGGDVLNNFLVSDSAETWQAVRCSTERFELRYQHCLSLDWTSEAQWGHEIKSDWHIWSETSKVA